MQQASGAELDGDVQAIQFLYVLFLLPPQIPLQMRQHRRNAALCRQRVNLVDHAAAPRGEGQFQQQITARTETQRLKIVPMVHIWHPCHLCTQHKVRKRFGGFLHRCGKMLPSGLTTREKLLYALPVPMKMGGERYTRNALRCLHAEHCKTGCRVRRAIVHAGQNMGVKIGHGMLRSPLSGFSCPYP